MKKLISFSLLGLLLLTGLGAGAQQSPMLKEYKVLSLKLKQDIAFDGLMRSYASFAANQQTTQTRYEPMKPTGLCVLEPKSDWSGPHTLRKGTVLNFDANPNYGEDGTMTYSGDVDFGNGYLACDVPVNLKLTTEWFYNTLGAFFEITLQ